MVRAPALSVLKVTTARQTPHPYPLVVVNTPSRVLLRASIVPMGTLVTSKVNSKLVKLVKCACGAIMNSRPEEDLAMPVTTVTTV